MNRISKDDAYEVSDSTDWNPTPIPKLAEVDSALRCRVCKDFYTTPMTTSCDHTFCSLCIRRSLNSEGKCPACWKPDQEMKLRLNRALEEVVEAFKRARPQLMEVATKPVEIIQPASPKRKRREERDEQEDMSRKKPRTSGRRTRSSQTEVIEVMDSAGEEDEDYLPDGMVQCPVCNKIVKETAINTHLDQNCIDEPRVTKSFGRGSKQTMSVPTIPDKPLKRPERLPSPNFQFIKDPALRKKLTDQGLSAAGPRQLLERRYTEWVTLWNANCDATLPKPTTELRRELDKWDKTLGKNTISAQGALIKDKDFDGKAWSNTHKADFKNLVAQARSKVKKPETASSSSSTPMSQATGSSPSTPVEGHAHGEMDVTTTEDSPDKSRSRFFDESRPNGDQDSSQNWKTVPILQKNANVASDITTPHPLPSQP